MISAFFETFNSLRSGALKYILVSGLAALVIFGMMLWVAWTLSGSVSAYIAGLTPWQWAHESVFFGFIIGLSVIIGFMLLMKYIILIAMSPLLSYISEKAEKSLFKDYQASGFSTVSSVARSLRINSRNMFKEVLLTIILLIAGLIPGLNIIALPLLLIVQAYFAGFGIMDYYLERHLTFHETLFEVYRHKYASILLGGLFMVLFAIPVIGAIIAPYITTVTGTQYFLRQKMINIQTK